MLKKIKDPLSKIISSHCAKLTVVVSVELFPTELKIGFNKFSNLMSKFLRKSIRVEWRAENLH